MVVGCECDGVEEGVELEEAAVDVADGESAGYGGLNVFHFILPCSIDEARRMAVWMGRSRW